MANPSYSDIYDPKELQALVGKSWVNETSLFKTGIFKWDVRPLQGTQVTTIWQKRFQGRSGQTVPAGGSISPTVKVQTAGYAPIIWRYDSVVESDVNNQIEAKGLPAVKASMADDVKEAAMQYSEDAAIAVIKGVGAAMTGNQAGSGATVSLDGMVDGLAALDDQGYKLNGGAAAMRSAIYYKLLKLGVVAQTSNTWGIDAQNNMVKSGQIPENVLGLTPIVTNKIADLGSNKSYVYYIGKEALHLQGNTLPTFEVAKLTVNGIFGTKTNFYITFAVGAIGATWGKAASEVISDTDLETSANWTLANTAQKFVNLARVHVASA